MLAGIVPQRWGIVLLILLAALVGLFAPAVAGLEMKQLHATIGAEVLGIDLSAQLSDATHAALDSALVEHKLLVVRRQGNMTADSLRSFTLRWGALHVHLESASHLQGYTDVNVVSNIRNADGAVIGLYGKHVESYHSDLSWAHLPTKVTVLKSVIRPETCGDTHFLDSTAAYEGLNATFRATLGPLRARYCYMKTRDLSVEVGLSAELVLVALGCA